MTSTDDRSDSDDRHPLNHLHRQALAGEVTAEELLKACHAYLLALAERRQRTDPDLRDIGADGCAGQVLANVLISKDGGQGDQLGLFPGVECLAAYLSQALRNKLNTEYKQARRRRAGQPRPESTDAPASGPDGDDRPRELPDPSAVINLDDIVARAAYSKARRRTAPLREEAIAGRHCPFHMLRPCPHADSVIGFLEQAVNFGGLLSDEEISDLLAEKGRTLSLPANRTGAGRRRQAGPPQADFPQTLSDHGHTLDRHFRRCFEWWWYRALAGTELDPATDRPDGLSPNQPSSSADRLRLPIVGRLRLTRNGDWNREACSLPGAVQLILQDQEFWRLLFTYKPDVYDYLERRTS